MSDKINNEDLWDTKQLVNNFFLPYTGQIIGKLNNAMTSNYDKQKSLQIYLLIGLCVVLVAIFLILCYPFLKEIYSIIKVSRKMLFILPIECIIRCKYFKKLILKRSRF